MQLSQNALSIEHSAIRKMFNKALKYDHIISFTLGEPDFTASENVVEAGCKAICDGHTKYSANSGASQGYRRESEKGHRQHLQSRA